MHQDFPLQRTTYELEVASKRNEKLGAEIGLRSVSPKARTGLLACPKKSLLSSIGFESLMSCTILLKCIWIVTSALSPVIIWTIIDTLVFSSLSFSCSSSRKMSTGGTSTTPSKNSGGNASSSRRAATNRKYTRTFAANGTLRGCECARLCC